MEQGKAIPAITHLGLSYNLLLGHLLRSITIYNRHGII